MTQNIESIPVIIRDWAAIINNPSFNQNTRDNYYVNLKAVSKFIEEELRKCDNAKLKATSFKQVKKKK